MHYFISSELHHISQRFEPSSKDKPEEQNNVADRFSPTCVTGDFKNIHTTLKLLLPGVCPSLEEAPSRFCE